MSTWISTGKGTNMHVFRCATVSFLYDIAEGMDREALIEGAIIRMEALSKVSGSARTQISLLRYEDEAVCQSMDSASDVPLCLQHYDMLEVLIELLETDTSLLPFEGLVSRVIKEMKGVTIRPNGDILYPIIFREAVRRFRLRNPQYTNNTAVEPVSSKAGKKRSCNLCNNIQRRIEYIIENMRNEPTKK